MFGAGYGFDDAGKAATKAEQKAWVAKRNLCSSKECIIDAYKKRIDEICGIPVVSGVNDCQSSASLAMGNKQDSAVDPVAADAATQVQNHSNEVAQSNSQNVVSDTRTGNPSPVLQPDVSISNAPAAQSEAAEFDGLTCQWPEEFTREGIDRNVDSDKFLVIEPGKMIKTKNKITLPNGMKTKDEIIAAKEYLDKIEPEIKNKISALDKQRGDCSSISMEINYRVNRLIDDKYNDHSNEIGVLMKRKEDYDKYFQDISRALELYRDLYKIDDARDQILFAENDIVAAEKKAAQDKIVAGLREKANLNEEEYLVPLFECSVQGSYWCFSSSHKVYAVTNKVTLADGSDQYAAVYQEVGEGEVNDYYKDKSSIAAEIFVGRDNAYSNAATQNYVSQIKMWVAGTGRMPHVFMDKKRR